MFEDRFYVYRFICPIDLVVIYVGQGQGGRVGDQLYNLRRNTHTNKGLQEKFNSLKAKGKELIYDFPVKHITKAEAYKSEIELIAQYGRLDLRKGTLFNKTDGGAGPSNMVLSEKSILSRKTTWIGRHHEDDAKKKIGNFHRNKIVSAETRLKQSIAAKNRAPASEETRIKIGEASRRRVQSEATKEKCRQNALDQHRRRKLEKESKENNSLLP